MKASLPQTHSVQRIKRQNPLIIGTFVLTVTGLISRIIGFFYRIFLSHLFGEEGMGIYQLISPVMAFVSSLCASGLQTSVSKFVAAEPSTKDYKASFRIVLTGFTLSVTLSVICSVIVYGSASFIASDLLLEPRCEPLLRILALSFPFGAFHSIVNGYFYGIKSTKIPAVTQLIEQSVRVGSVFMIYLWADARQECLKISVAVVGLVIGEVFSMLISLFAIYHRFYRVAMPKRQVLHKCSRLLPRSIELHAVQQQYTQAKSYVRHTSLYQTACCLVAMALPLSLSRITVNLLQSIEAVYLPESLRSFGMNTSESLSIYGVLTGMALPLILFPSALISSICVLLLPVVSEAQESGNKAAVKRAKDKTVLYCSMFGAFCTAGFLLFGRLAGRMLFHSELAGGFIQTLSFICPFMYISSTLSSILHGLGKTGITFALNVACLSIRLLFVFFLVPVYGIQGYLWGLLASELCTTLIKLGATNRYIRKL